MGFPTHPCAWHVLGALWNSACSHHAQVRFTTEPRDFLVSVCFYFYFYHHWGSAPSSFHPKHRMVAGDFHALPKHCLSFRLHQRRNLCFRIFFITLNSPPAFVGIFSLQRDEVKSVPRVEMKWGRRTSSDLCVQT